MRRIFRKDVLLALAVFILAASTGYAAAPKGVAFTRHNLSASSYYTDYASGTEQEVCIFCHTPHGGTLNTPLWNRPYDNIPEGGSVDISVAGHFTHYNSVTLSSAIQNLSATRAVSQESLICMTCHDGSIAVNRVLNPNNVTGPPDDGVYIYIEDRTWSGKWYSKQIGASPAFPGNMDWGHLEDDHPISFSYYDAEADPSENGLKPADALYSAFVSGAEGPRFFGGAGAGNMRVECSSCHDPHVAYDEAVPGSPADRAYTPFLVMSNTGSKLCFACHNK